MMDLCNSCLRSFNDEVARDALRLAKENKLTKIIELGAGRGPVTAAIAESGEGVGISLVVCDLEPNTDSYRTLQKRYPEQVFPVYTPVDMTDPNCDLSNAVLILSTTMHHIPFEVRPLVLRSLTETNSRIAVFEPIVRTWKSMFLAALSFFAVLALPVVFFKRSGKLRRILWCWIVPIAPCMFAWDGVISCLRQWRVAEWQAAFETLPNPPQVEYQTGFNSLKIFWAGVAASQEACTSATATGNSS